MIYVGIDPGEKGAIAILDSGLPTIIIQSPDLATSLLEINFGREVFVAIEQPIKVPFQNVNATSTQWRNFGELVGVCKARGLNSFHVGPRTWQKEILPGKLGKRQGEKASHYRKRFKLYCIETMSLMFKDVEVKNDGIADALGIALWAKKYRAT